MSTPLARLGILVRLDIRSGDRRLSAPVYAQPCVLHIGPHLYEHTRKGEIKWTGPAHRLASGSDVRLLASPDQVNVEIVVRPGDTVGIAGYATTTTANHDRSVLTFRKL